jgi:hypothetical protein
MMSRRRGRGAFTIKHAILILRTQHASKTSSLLLCIVCRKSVCRRTFGLSMLLAPIPPVVTHGPFWTANNSKDCYGYIEIVTILSSTATAMRRHVTAPSIFTSPSAYPNGASLQPDINGAYRPLSMHITTVPFFCIDRSLLSRRAGPQVSPPRRNHSLGPNYVRVWPSTPAHHTYKP